MTLPGAETLYRVIDATWPPAETVAQDGWLIRRGGGGGSRVSAATAQDARAIGHIAAMEARHRAWGQPPLVMIRDGDEALDAVLAGQGYEVADPVWLYAAPAVGLAGAPLPRLAVFEVWPPLAIQAEIWAAGGIGPARLAVMGRSAGPRTSLMAREDRPAGTAFVGLQEGVAMIHALEVRQDFRRRGIGARLVRAAAHWTVAQGGAFVSLVVTRRNLAANRLYTFLGMRVVGQYHYRRKSS